MKNIFKKIENWLKKIIYTFFICSILLVILFRFVQIPFTPLMGIRYIEQITNGEKIHFKRKWITLNKIKNLPLAVLASEDATFMNHWGFDFDAMQKAFKDNKKGKRIKGGSTISQQTAKNVFLCQSRSYFRKIIEAYFTVLIELFWSKERILEVYLNVIEMGDGIYGAEAAAQKYFKKSASKLTREEASAIAAILPNPRKWNPVQKTAYIQKRCSIIGRNMKLLKEPKFD